MIKVLTLTMYCILCICILMINKTAHHYDITKGYFVKLKKPQSRVGKDIQTVYISRAALTKTTNLHVQIKEMPL